MVSFTALRGNHPNFALTPASGKEALVQIRQIPYADAGGVTRPKNACRADLASGCNLTPTAGRSDLGIRFWVAFLLGWGSPS